MKVLQNLFHSTETHHVKLVSKPREDERLAEDIRRPAKANYVTNYTLSRHKEEQSEGLLNSFSVVGKYLFFCCVRPVVILLSLALQVRKDTSVS